MTLLLKKIHLTGSSHTFVAVVAYCFGYPVGLYFDFRSLMILNTHCQCAYLLINFYLKLNNNN